MREERAEMGLAGDGEAAASVRKAVSAYNLREYDILNTTLMLHIGCTILCF
jgi:hypothetical protein